MTTVPNHPPAGQQARPPLTREQLLFVIANVASQGVTCPTEIKWVELPSGRELELMLPEDDRTAVNLFAATFGLPKATESDQESNRGRRARRWYGTTSTRDRENPLFGGWRIAVNCYVSAGPARACAPVGATLLAPRVSA